MSPMNWQRRQRRWWRKHKRRRAWENFSDGGGGSVFTCPGNLQQQRWRRHRKTVLRTQWQRRSRRQRTKNILRVQGIRDGDGGGSGSTTGPMDFQRQLSVDFLCYCVTNSNTVVSLYRRCLVLVLFSSDSFFFFHCKYYYQYCNHAENIFVPIVH